MSFYPQLRVVEVLGCICFGCHGLALWDRASGVGDRSQGVTKVVYLFGLTLGHFQVGSYRYRSLIEGPYTL